MAVCAMRIAIVFVFDFSRGGDSDNPCGKFCGVANIA